MSWHEADDMPVRWQARTLGVYRTAIFTWTEDGDGYRAQGYVFLARSGRWSRLMFDTNRSPPRLTRAEAEADFRAQRPHTTAQARAIFRDAYHGATNLMTPDVIRFGWTGDFAFEISKGDFMHQPLFAVTVIHATEGKQPDLSRSFGSDLDAAVAYATNLPNPERNPRP